MGPAAGRKASEFYQTIAKGVHSRGEATFGIFFLFFQNFLDIFSEKKH